MAHVIYVHGLWMPGDESLILRRRLAQEFDLALHAFRYSAAYSTMNATTARLEASCASCTLRSAFRRPQLRRAGHPSLS